MFRSNFSYYRFNSTFLDTSYLDSKHKGQPVIAQGRLSVARMPASAYHLHPYQLRDELISLRAHTLPTHPPPTVTLSPPSLSLYIILCIVLCVCKGISFRWPILPVLLNLHLFLKAIQLPYLSLSSSMCCATYFLSQ